MPSTLPTQAATSHTRDATTNNIASKLHQTGYTDLVSVTPPDCELSPSSKIAPDQRGKAPGRRNASGLWHGYSWRMKDISPAELERTGANVGLRGTRFPGLDIDAEDAPLANTIAQLAARQLGAGPVRLSREPRRLLVFRLEGEPFGRLALRIQYKGRGHLVEWLGEGRQYLVHGTHPSGSEYRWLKRPLWDWDPEDLPVVTREAAVAFLDDLARRLNERGIQAERVGDGQDAAEKAPPQEDLKAPSMDALVELPLPPNPPDYGWDEFIAHGYAFKAAGGDDAFPLWVRWAEQHPSFDPDVCEHEWPKLKPPFRAGWSWLCEQAGVDTSVYDFDPAPVPEPRSDGEPQGSPRLSALHELNQTYAVVQVGADVVILQERGDAVDFLKPAAFKLKLGNRRVPSAVHANRDEELARAWLGWPDRREYERAVFRPGEATVPEEEYNLWRGWAVEPSPAGDCGHFLEHLRDVVCQDAAAFEWLVDWLAHLFQRPQEKPGTVVGLRGGQGAGKSIVGAVLKRLLGPCHVTADKADQVTGKFNAHLERCLLLQAEEAFWGGSKQAEGALKHLATGETLRIERKGIDSEERPNFTRLLITSNEDHVWPTSLDDRRLVVFEVSSERTGDRAYFDRLFRQLESGGYEKLLHLLLTRRIDLDRLRQPPRTAALEAQAAESMNPEERWLHQLLQSGEIIGEPAEGGGVRVAIANLYDDYAREAGPRERRKNRKAFGYFVQERLRAEKTGDRERVNTLMGLQRSHLYQLPPLAELREAYSRRGRAATLDWDGPGEWVPLGPLDGLPIEHAEAEVSS